MTDWMHVFEAWQLLRHPLNSNVIFLSVIGREREKVELSFWLSSCMVNSGC